MVANRSGITALKKRDSIPEYTHAHVQWRRDHCGHELDASVLGRDRPCLMPRRPSFPIPLTTSSFSLTSKTGRLAPSPSFARMAEELGIVGCVCREVGCFTYRAELGRFVEHVVDHVFVTDWAGTANPDPAEVSELCWMGIDELRHDLVERPDRYVAWLGSVMELACADCC